MVRERERECEGWREVDLEIVRKNERERHRERERAGQQRQKQKKGIRGNTSPSDRRSLFGKYERGAPQVIKRSPIAFLMDAEQIFFSKNLARSAAQ